jgi:acyl dehydratase
MLLLHFAVDFADPAGEVVAVARYTSAYLQAAATSAGTSTRTVRGAKPGVFGDALPERSFGPVTMTDIVRYQGASGDFNPMHHDDELARSAGYPAAFSVGMLGAGYLATYCVDLVGVESVGRLRTRFRGLVFRGETLRVRGRSTAGRHLELTLENERGEVVIEAQVDLR